MVNYEEIRRELEKQYESVIFIKTNLGNTSSKWFINNEEINIAHDWHITHIPAIIEKNKVVNNLSNNANITHNMKTKLENFRSCIVLGLIKADHTLYKKYTNKQLEKMLEDA